jgi:hypothetical protein
MLATIQLEIFFLPPVLYKEKIKIYETITLPQASSRKVAVSIPDEVTIFFNLPNPSSRIMALESTQPLTEMSARNISGGKGRPARKADNLTAIYESIV